MQASGYPSVQQNQTALMTKFMQKFTVQNKLRSDFAFLANYSAQRCQRGKFVTREFCDLHCTNNRLAIQFTYEFQSTSCGHTTQNNNCNSTTTATVRQLQQYDNCNRTTTATVRQLQHGDGSARSVAGSVKCVDGLVPRPGLVPRLHAVTASYSRHESLHDGM